MMKRILSACLALFAVLGLWLGLAVWRTSASTKVPVIRSGQDLALPAAENPLRVMIWNIGYSGLGEESDFQADGGKMLQPPSVATVRKNLAGIQDVLRSADADFVLMQEVAAPGFLTRGVNVLGGVRAALPDYAMTFSSDIRTFLFPRPISLKHGMATFRRVGASETNIHRLTDEPGAISGFIRRRYHVQATEFSAGGQDWVIIDVHLSAFDEGASTRLTQLREVLDIAEAYYADGKAVVMGGDWNMRLAATDFPYTSDESALFWVHDFPADQLADGWQLVFDPAVPTTRTNEQPFSEGVNYRTIIDGLVVSPNVNVVAAKGIELHFKYTDHQPVVFTLEHK
ncbi:MAG: hypothetical protein R3C13_00835 [Hyphomonas sp.]|uniref:endonuclease/exonuclease/phosphatase family protein n=1 Tax=Hyphomonas sp. TaxID=87 RepID=UPI003527DAE0